MPCHETCTSAPCSATWESQAPGSWTVITESVWFLVVGTRGRVVAEARARCTHVCFLP